MKISTKIRLERIHIIRFFPAFSREPNRGEREREGGGITMKMTGSRVLALTAALTASSIFRESMCFSRYCCTDISCFFFLVLLCISFEIYNVCARNGFKIFLKNLFLYWKSGNLGSWERERERESWALILQTWRVAWELGIWIHRDFAALLSKLENLRSSQLAGFKNF